MRRVWGTSAKLKKRGPIVGFAGVCLTGASFLAVLAIVPGGDPTFAGEIFSSNFLEGMFDYVSEERQIYPQDSTTFSYSGMEFDIPLLWGLQITDYQTGDSYSVKASNIFGDEFGTYEDNVPVLFDMFVMPKADVYNFEIKNLGDRPINVVMMFSEDPDNSEALSDPNSPLMRVLMPLAIAGIVLMIGIIVIIIGGIITIIDWQKNKEQSKYY